MRATPLLIALSMVLSADAAAQFQIQRLEGDPVQDLDSDGSTLVVSRAFHSEGIELPRFNVEFYTWSNSAWQHVTSIARYAFATGASVAVSGLWAVIGEPIWDGEIGRIRLFHREEAGWVTSGEISAPPTEFMDPRFGSQVEIDGRWLLVRSSRHSRGEVHFYEELDGAWVYRQSTHSSLLTTDMALANDVAVIGPSVYRLQGAEWVVEAQLDQWSDECSENRAATDGRRIVLTLVAGTCGANQERSAAYVYAQEDSGAWVLQDSLMSPDTFVAGWGSDLTIQDSTLLISGHLYLETNAGWERVTVVTGSHSVGHLQAGRLNPPSAVTGYVDSEVYVFDTSRSAGSPILTQPVSATHLESVDPLVVRLQWEPVAEATGYVVAATHGLPEAERVAGTSHQITLRALDVDTIRYDMVWQVSAVFDDGIGPASTARFEGQVDGFDFTRFTPTVVGNYWEYRTEFEDSRVDGEGEPTSVAYVSYEVLPPLEIEAEEYVVIRTRTFDEARKPVAMTVCAYGPENEEIRIPQEDDPAEDGCPWLLISLPTYGFEGLEENTSIEISGVTYEVDALGRFAFVLGGAREGGAGTHFFAAGVGLIRYGAFTWGIANADSLVSFTTQFEANLIFARLNGEVYGQSLVSNDPAELPNSLVLTIGALYPNPVDRTLNVNLQGAAPGVLSIDFFDVTGRLVHRASQTSYGGASTARIDLPDGPSGLLLVCVTDAQGQSAIGRVMRISVGPH